MPATPAMYDPNAKPLRWFEASFKGGYCCHCGEDINEGDQIAYAADRQLVRRECCGDEPSEAIKQPSQGMVRVMPPGPRRAACPRCFIIHTVAQGDNCE